MEEPVSYEVDAAGRDGKDLIVRFQLQAKVCLEIFPDLPKKPVKRWLIRRQKDHIVQVPEIVPDFLFLLQPVIEVRQVKIGEVLREIVADRKARRAVDDLLEEP